MLLQKNADTLRLQFDFNVSILDLHFILEVSSTATKYI